MGLYDNFRLPETPYVSTYAGIPLEETEKLQQANQDQYLTGMQGINAYNVMRDNANVLEVDRKQTNAIFDKGYQAIKEYAERGDLENSIPTIMKATSMISGNQDLKDMMNDKVRVSKYAEGLSKALESGKIPKWNYDKLMAGISNYKGKASGENLSGLLEAPTPKFDLAGILIERGKTVRKQEKEVSYMDPVTNKLLTKTASYYDEGELQAALMSVLNEPEAQEYRKKMQEALGVEATNAYFNNTSQQAYDALNIPEEYSRQYTSIDNSGGGGDGYGNNNDSGYGADTGYTFNYGLDIETSTLFVGLKGNKTREEYVKLREEGKSMTGTVGAIVGSAGIKLQDVGATDQELDRGKQRQEGIILSAGYTKREFDLLSQEEQEGVINDYLDKYEENYSQVTANGINHEDLIGQGLVSPNAQYNIDKGRQVIEKDIKATASGRSYYDLDKGERVQYGDDSGLRDAIYQKNGSSLEITGSANPASLRLSDEDSDLSNSWIAVATYKNGDTRGFLIDKGRGYRSLKNISISIGEGKVLRYSNSEFDLRLMDTSAKLDNMLAPTEFEIPNGGTVTVRRIPSEEGKFVQILSSTDKNGKPMGGASGQVDIATLTRYIISLELTAK